MLVDKVPPAQRVSISKKHATQALIKIRKSLKKVDQAHDDIRVLVDNADVRMS